MKRATTFLSLLALSAGLLAQSSVKTERQYLRSEEHTSELQSL